ETGLIGGERVRKNDPRVCLLGDLDEFNAALGLASAHAGRFTGLDVLLRIQKAVFSLGAEVASPDERWRAEGLEALTSELEGQIDEWTEALPPLTNFILPGGTLLSASLHLARAVCRHAERSMVGLSLETEVRSEALVFMNRASDWLFCAARAANSEAGVADVPWSGESS
ncbi:MAG TPA: cob(I)yrinic acid a,c-diamide adenosyltransferase, partial [Fimbriimonadaceae bacterium]|nr:cob(I)yrinic acid a,c-diamide adenosyltransferase [Fimbriimonadaceae bacterium]